jgi:hypothetical protein
MERMGKPLLRPKKARQESVKCEGVVDFFFFFFFFVGRPLFIMSLFHVVRKSMDSFTWRSWSIWGRQSEGRGLRGGETRPGCCTMTTQLLTRCSLSMNFWWNTRWLSFPNRLTVHIWPLWTFFCYWSWNPLWEVADFRKFTTGPMHYPAKRVPELEKNFGSGV